jgi:hypothetical protein
MQRDRDNDDDLGFPGKDDDEDDGVLVNSPFKQIGTLNKVEAVSLPPKVLDEAKQLQVDMLILLV